MEKDYPEHEREKNTITSVYQASHHLKQWQIIAHLLGKVLYFQEIPIGPIYPYGLKGWTSTWVPLALPSPL